MREEADQDRYAEKAEVRETDQDAQKYEAKSEGYLADIRKTAMIECR